MLYVCTACGLVYFLEHVYFENGKICAGCKTTDKWKRLEISATARSSEYSEAGGDITGIDTNVTIEVNTCE